jgi:hypothetical protein
VQERASDFTNGWKRPGIHFILRCIACSPRRIPFILRRIPFSPRRILYVPRSIPFSLRRILYVPRSIPFNPRRILHVPRRVPFSPRRILYVLRRIPFSPRHILYVPRRIPFSPRRIPYVPRSIPLSPRRISYILRRICFTMRFIFRNRGQTVGQKPWSVPGHSTSRIRKAGWSGVVSSRLSPPVEGEEVTAGPLVAKHYLPVTSTEARICDDDDVLGFNQNTDVPPFGTYGHTCEKVTPEPQAHSCAAAPLLETQMHIEE